MSSAERRGGCPERSPSQPVSPSSPSLCSLRRPGKSRHPTKGSSDVFLIIIFSLWRSLKTCACTCSLSQGTWAGLGVGAGKDAPAHSHAAQGPGRPPPGPLGDRPGPQQPAWQQAKCLGRALALGPQCLAWARLSQRSSEVSAKRAGSRVALSSINQARGLVPGLGDTAHCVLAD